MATVSDLSLQTPFVDQQGRLTTVAIEYLIGPAPGSALSLVQAIQASVIFPCAPIRYASPQNASIPATQFALGTLPGGYYRLSAFLQLTKAGTLSSSLTVTFGFTNGGQVGAAVAGALNTNIAGDVEPLSAFIRSDANAPITYKLDYLSNGPNEAQYEASFAIERIG